MLWVIVAYNSCAVGEPVVDLTLSLAMSAGMMSNVRTKMASAGDPLASLQSKKNVKNLHVFTLGRMTFVDAAEDPLR